MAPQPNPQVNRKMAKIMHCFVQYTLVMGSMIHRVFIPTLLIHITCWQKHNCSPFSPTTKGNHCVWPVDFMLQKTYENRRTTSMSPMTFAICLWTIFSAAPGTKTARNSWLSNTMLTCPLKYKYSTPKPYRQNIYTILQMQWLVIEIRRCRT